MSALANQLFCSLSQEEFKLVLSIAFLDSTDKFAGSYGTERFATPSLEGKTDRWVEMFLRAARYLAFECRYEFASLVLREDGRVFSQGEVEPGNSAYLVLLDTGSLPDMELAFETALQMIEEGRVKVDAGPIRAGLQKVRADVKTAEALAKADPEMRAIRKARAAALRGLLKEGTVN